MAVNLLSDALESNLSSAVSLGLGIALLFGGISYIAMKELSSAHVATTARAFVVTNRETGELVEVPHYYFAEELCRITEAIFSENEAFARQWKEYPIAPDPYQQELTSYGAAALLLEAAEFMLIRRLSLTLSSQFDEERLNKEAVWHFTRKDVPDVLLENRVFDLLTRDPRDRAPFGKGGDVSDTVTMIHGPGKYYSRFELRLPYGSKIERLARGHLVIRSPAVTLNLKVRFRGTGYNTPTEFLNRYVGRYDLWTARVFALDFEVSGTIEGWLALRKNKWDFYRWTEYLMDDLTSSFDGDHFFRQISWPIVRATLESLERQQLERIPHNLT